MTMSNRRERLDKQLIASFLKEPLRLRILLKLKYLGFYSYTTSTNHVLPAVDHANASREAQIRKMMFGCHARDMKNRTMEANISGNTQYPKRHTL